VSKYAAFLRGMNVGGHRIKNDELRSQFEAMDFRDVSIFRASGNVVFTAEREPLAEMTVRIEAGLAESLGYEVPTFLRADSEVRVIAAFEPFAPAQVHASAGRLQVAMLSTQPVARARSDVLALATDQDRLAFGVREFYWLPSGGMMDSALDLKAIGALLGPMTTRTKNTVEQIASKHFAN
jgi:uncharacterized protein (DUF1697 family)